MSTATAPPRADASPLESELYVDGISGCSILCTQEKNLRAIALAGRVGYIKSPGGRIRYRLSDLLRIRAESVTPAVAG